MIRLTNDVLPELLNPIIAIETFVSDFEIISFITDIITNPSTDTL